MGLGAGRIYDLLRAFRDSNRHHGRPPRRPPHSDPNRSLVVGVHRPDRQVTRYWTLLLVRFLFGAGEAGAYPNISAAITRWFPDRERGRAMGIAWMASRIGGAISP